MACCVPEPEALVPPSATSPPSRRAKVMAFSLGETLTTLVGLVTASALSRLLSKSDYATYRQTLLAFAFAAPLVSLGLTNSIYYFLPTEQTRPRGVVADNVLALLIMAATLALFLSFGGNHLLVALFGNPGVARTLLFLIPYPFAALPAQLLASVLVVRNRVPLLTAFNVTSRALLGLGTILPAVFMPTADAPLLGNVAVTVASGLVALSLIVRFAGTSGPRRPKWSGMVRMVRFGFPLGVATMVGTLSLQLDKIIVSAMCGPEDFAVYSNGAVEIPLVGIVTGSISAVILADMRRMIAKGDDGEALALFLKAAEKGANLLLPTMCFLLVVAEPFIELLYSSKYTESMLPFRVYLFMLPARIVVWGSLLIAIGQNKVILTRSIGHLLVNVLLSVYLVSKIGYMGAAVGGVAATYLWSIPLSLRVLSKHFQVRFWHLLPLRHLGRLLLCLVVPTMTVALLEAFCPDLVPFVALSVFGAVFVVLFALFLPNSFRIDLVALVRRVFHLRAL